MDPPVRTRHVFAQSRHACFVVVGAKFIAIKCGPRGLRTTEKLNEMRRVDGQTIFAYDRVSQPFISRCLSRNKSAYSENDTDFGHRRSASDAPWGPFRERVLVRGQKADLLLGVGQLTPCPYRSLPKLAVPAFCWQQNTNHGCAEVDPSTTQRVRWRPRPWTDDGTRIC